MFRSVHAAAAFGMLLGIILLADTSTASAGDTGIFTATTAAGVNRLALRRTVGSGNAMRTSEKLPPAASPIVAPVVSIGSEPLKKAGAPTVAATVSVMTPGRTVAAVVEMPVTTVTAVAVMPSLRPAHAEQKHASRC